MGPSTSTNAGPSPHPRLSDPVLRGLPRCVWSPKSSVHLLPTYTIHTTQHLGATSQASGCSHKHTVGSWRTDQGKRSACLDTGSECLEGNSRVFRMLSVVQKRGCVLQVGPAPWPMDSSPQNYGQRWSRAGRLNQVLRLWGATEQGCSFSLGGQGGRGQEGACVLRPDQEAGSPYRPWKKALLAAGATHPALQAHCPRLQSHPLPQLSWEGP